MTCGQYSLADLNAKELQKLKEAEKSLNNLSGTSKDRETEQEVVLIAYRHDHK